LKVGKRAFNLSNPNREKKGLGERKKQKHQGKGGCKNRVESGRSKGPQRRGKQAGTSRRGKRGIQNPGKKKKKKWSEKTTWGEKDRNVKQVKKKN